MPKSDVEWRSFQDSGALKLVGSAAANDDSTVSDIARNITATFKNCTNLNAELWNSHPDLLASLANLRKFTAARAVGGLDHFAMGFNVPDAQYFLETSTFTDVPADLQTSEILSAFSDPKRIDEALKMLETLNKAYASGKLSGQQMIYFRYTSQHLTTPNAKRQTPAESLDVYWWLFLVCPTPLEIKLIDGFNSDCRRLRKDILKMFQWSPLSLILTKQWTFTSKIIFVCSIEMPST